VKNIDLGKISVPLDDYASQGNAILGIRDSGKSYTATAIAERLMDAGIPIIAFDPIGIWRYLRVPGAGKGYEVVVAGGKQGDLPLTARGAQEIVRAAMRENVSLVVDLYDIHLSKANWREIVGSSIRTLLYENGERGLRHIFIEEAAEFCPQNVGPNQGEVYAEVEKLARMGGNALLGYTLINQRAEQVNKAVLELCDCLILHRQKGRNSINALSKWLDIASVGKGSDIITSLPMLAQGECWVWPAGSDKPVRTKVPAKHSFHPDRRARQAAPKGEQRQVDVSAFVGTMKSTLETLVKEAEANDPKLLRAEIAKLRSQRQPVDIAGAQQLAEAEQRGYERGRIEAARVLRDVASDAASKIHVARGQLNIAAGHVDNLAEIASRLPRPDDVRAVHSKILTDAVRTILPGPSGYSMSGESLPKAERKILTALAQYPQGRTKTQIAVLTGYAVNGGGFANAIGALRSANRIEGGAERLTITNAGLDALGPYEPLPQGAQLLEHWYSQLGKAERKALEALVEVYPRTLSKPQIAARAGYEPNGGGFANALGRLRSLELIRGRGEIQASEDLFDG
jgi:hypothetical protein